MSWNYWPVAGPEKSRNMRDAVPIAAAFFESRQRHEPHGTTAALRSIGMPEAGLQWPVSGSHKRVVRNGQAPSRECQGARLWLALGPCCKAILESASTVRSVLG